MPQGDPRVADLVAAGAIGIGLFLPQYSRDPASGEVKGIGTGLLALELTRVIAARLGIAARVVQYPAPDAAIAGLKSATCDAVFLGIAPSRAADADQKEVRIGIVDGHASALALRSMVKHARLVGAELPEQTFDLLKQGQVDALAFPRDHVLDFAGRLPGSRVLAKGYGINQVGIAVRKGRAGLLAYCSEFSREVLASGAVQSIIDRASLPGFEAVATRATG